MKGQVILGTMLSLSLALAFCLFLAAFGSGIEARGAQGMAAAQGIYSLNSNSLAALASAQLAMR